MEQMVSIFLTAVAQAKARASYTLRIFDRV